MASQASILDDDRRGRRVRDLVSRRPSERHRRQACWNRHRSISRRSRGCRISSSVSFGGYGNATSRPVAIGDFYDARQRPVAGPSGGRAGARRKPRPVSSRPKSNTRPPTARPIVISRRIGRMGSGTFNQAGLSLGAIYKLYAAPDSEGSEHTHHRAVVEAHARYFPAMLDLRSAFEDAALTASVASSLPLPTRPLLVVRAGATKGLRRLSVLRGRDDWRRRHNAVHRPAALCRRRGAVRDVRASRPARRLQAAGAFTSGRSSDSPRPDACMSTATRPAVGMLERAAVSGSVAATRRL
mgnify:CR=1 FL=1